MRKAPVPPGRECSTSQAEAPEEIAVSRHCPYLGRPLVRLTEEQIEELERLPIYQQLMEWLFRPLPVESQQAGEQKSKQKDKDPGNGVLPQPA
jgi:hypothetical protein